MRRAGQLLLILVTSAVTVAGGPAAAPSSAATSAYREVLGVYESAGTIPPCRFDATELQSALSGVDTYGAQYFADFTDAIQSALTSRAAGDCGGAAKHAAVAGGAGSTDAVASLPSVTAPTSAGIPAPLIALGILIVIGALTAGAVAVARARRDRALSR